VKKNAITNNLKTHQQIIMFNIFVLATTNQNKVREFQHGATTAAVELKSLADFSPLPPVIEDGADFDENAYKKALHYARVLGLPAIADDSGLEVEALGGAPGVRSARYAGESATDEDNCALLLKNLENIQNRRAAFVCVVSIAVPSGPALTYEARCEGTILTKPRGAGGFGYDPLFYFEPLQKSFAELDIDQKNRVSHRGKVLSEINSEWEKIRKWTEVRLMEAAPPKPDHDQFMDNDWS
jgi:XTP/dITP diphosphohydrolase